MRRALKAIGVSFLVGALCLGAAWAGAGLTSTPVDLSDAGKATEVEGTAKAAKVTPLRTQMAAEEDPATVTPKPGEVLAGAAKISMYPQPPEGATWERDPDACKPLSAPGGKFAHATHIPNAESPWPENPNCIYSGGYGIGPTNPLTEYDGGPDGTTPNPEEQAGHPAPEGGLWVRTFAIKGSNGKTFTGTIIDGEGWFWDYKSKCDDCGIKQIAAAMGQQHEAAGLTADGVMIASTHSHAAPDFIGGWGFVPDWYMTQVTNAIKDSITQAVTTMKPARLEFGEETARQFNSERRATYRAAEEQQISWLRAVAIAGSATPTSKTIFTAGTYAAHPVSRDAGPVAYSDWHGTFSREIERRFGGVALAFPSGLGNMSSRMGGDGVGLARLIPEVGDGIEVTNTDLRYGRTIWAHPASNAPLTALGVPGFFDREFLTAPAAINVGENPASPCTSASPASVEMNVQGLRIGNQVALTASPGEVFSNLTNTLKDRSDAIVTLPVGQANDALGYMPQSFERAMNEGSGQGLGFGPKGIAHIEYEDAYSIDRCIGDAVLENTIALLGTLKG